MLGFFGKLSNDVAGVIAAPSCGQSVALTLVLLWIVFLMSL